MVETGVVIAIGVLVLIGLLLRWRKSPRPRREEPDATRGPGGPT
jgi:hypothetical protein